MRCFPMAGFRKGCKAQRERKKKNGNLQRRTTRGAILRFSLLQLVTPHLIRYPPRIALLKRSNKYLITKLVLRFPFAVAFASIVLERLSNAPECRKHPDYWMLKRFTTAVTDINGSRDIVGNKNALTWLDRIITRL